MKPGRFTYHAPRDLEEALHLLAQHGDDAKVLAGGQSLMPLLNFRIASPAHLLDINLLPGLSTPSRSLDSWAVPALTRQRALENGSQITAELPMLSEAVVQVAHPQVRNRGTVCGSLAHADAAAELPAVMLALGARMRVASLAGERVVPVEDFFHFHLTTALEPDELLLGVVLDLPPAGTHMSFREFAARQGDFAVAGVAATVTVAPTGKVTSCRLAVSGVAPTPIRLRRTEGIVVDGHLQADTFEAAAESARNEVAPTGDVHADAGYRRQLVGILTKRVLCDVAKKASVTDD